jgi:hypothetical protein
MITDVNLVPGSDKQPDGHWRIDPTRLQNPPPPGTFAINSATNLMSPQIVLEVAVSNESMPMLTNIDLIKYFGPGTGTRCWIGLKLFKANTPTGTTRWWAGYAMRKRVNGVFVDEPDISVESMPIVATNNVPVTQLTNITFHVNVDTIIDPCQRPPAYPATIDIDLEEVRQVIIKKLV